MQFLCILLLFEVYENVKIRAMTKATVLKQALSVHDAPASHALFVKCSHIYPLLFW